jgi:hypothetical protein
MRTASVVVAFLGLSGVNLHASDLRSPWRVERNTTGAELLQVALEPGALATLDGGASFVLRDVALAPELEVDLALERISLADRKLDFVVDGVPAPALLDGLQLSLWSGRVLGASDSDVMLSFSSVGCRGWVWSDGELVHLIPDGATTRSKWVRDDALARAGAEPPLDCAAPALASSAPTHVAPSASAAATPHFLTSTLYECTVAVETDHQLNQVFGGNLSAESAYVATLLTWVSFRYEEQVGTVLTYPYVQLYTNANDPWTSGDTGAGAVNMLFEFQAAWQSNLPNGAQLGAFLSGASLGGGVAWLPGLCNPPYNFSVSGNLDGTVPFPVSQSPSNWDFMVVSHELGHNFGSPHTHDYCPPLDECSPGFGQCQTQQTCISNGTLMSYCHLCPGGLGNVAPRFHAANAADMRAWVEQTCLPFYCGDPQVYCTGKVNSLGCTPTISYTGHPTLSGLDDFHVRCTSVVNQKNGFVYWGLAPLAAPFQGGTKCVQSPAHSRTPTWRARA